MTGRLELFQDEDQLFGLVAHSVYMVKFEQPLNAEFPTDVTLFGITIFIKPLQPEDAKAPIFITPYGITLFLHPKINVLSAICIRQFPSLRYTGFPLSTIILAKL